MQVIEINMRRTKTITLRVPKNINELLEKTYRSLGYPSKSELIRDAVLEYIEYIERSNALNAELSEEEVYPTTVIMV
jgi:metal-responsive CopG/Arc/MetJ family transcriptional regulator